MKKIIQLIKKDWIIDWRQQNPIMSILLYLMTTIFTTYLVFRGVVSVEVWNALFWIILLFTSINAISKSFLQEKRRNMYYFFTCSSHAIIVSKLIYSSLQLIILGGLSLIIFLLLMGNPLESNFFLFLFNLFLSCIGFSAAFTMISVIAFKTNNHSVMMVVLGFPVIVPILLLSVSNASKILQGYIWVQIQGNVFTLMAVDAIIISLVFALFPFIWRS